MELLSFSLFIQRFISLSNHAKVATGSHNHNKWMGPAIRMSLPSFRVCPVRSARIWSPRTAESPEGSDGNISSTGSDVLADPDAQNQSILVLLSRPISALEFNSLRMHVDAMKIVIPHSKKVDTPVPESDGSYAPWFKDREF